MQKIKLLFNADIIAGAARNPSNRTGIFFTSYNILCQLQKNPKLDVALYISWADRLTLLSQLKGELAQCKIAEVYRKPLPFVIEICLRIFYKVTKIFGLKIKRNPEHVVNKKVINQYQAVFISYQTNPDIVAQSKNLTKYFVLYDLVPLLFPQYYPKDYHDWFINSYLTSIKSEYFYFAISANTQSDFLKHFPQIHSHKTKVTPLAADDNFQPHRDFHNMQLVKAKYNIPKNKKYLFSLCSLEPRKNLIMAVRAFLAFIKKHSIDDFVFVLGGAAWDGFIEKLEVSINDFDFYRDKIIRAGYVADDDLPILYSGAEFFVYTSQYEGFGLPPLEAMKCGKAVITSNNSSLPEVVGDAGIMIDYDNLDQHVAAYEKFYFELDLRMKYERRALLRAQEFTWEKCGAIISDFIILNQTLSV